MKVNRVLYRWLRAHGEVSYKGMFGRVFVRYFGQTQCSLCLRHIFHAGCDL